MSSYRPICDTWILARSKVKYYGAYPAGFLHRARALLGVHIDEPVLHLCSGRVRDYPYEGVGPCDYTLDVDGTLQPDLQCDITQEAVPLMPSEDSSVYHYWGAVLADPPYTVEDAARYGTAPVPSARNCLDAGLSVIEVGSRVGILHYVAPRPPKGVKFVALVTVFVGFENRSRLYSVYEKR